MQELLAAMRDATAVTHAVVESTSHGLALRKLEHCACDIAVVYNITADHLDYHGTREAYVAAKARLFASTGRVAKGRPRATVLNADDRSFAELRPHVRVPLIGYGFDAPADLHGTVVEATAAGSRVAVSGRWERWRYVGADASAFNVANALAAAAVALTQGMDLPEIGAGLASFGGVPAG
ncbi:MAG: Mur ligase family protein [Dehalococcoidia bacterium]